MARHPFFADMKKEQVALLTDCGMGVHFSKGQILFCEKDTANRFYALETGKVLLESTATYGKPLIVDEIGAGDLLGWSWMFPPFVWRFTARAAEETEAISFYGTVLREYCERDPALGFELLKRMSRVVIRRLQAARDKMLAVHAHEADLEPVMVDPDLATPGPEIYSCDDNDLTFHEGAD